MRAQRLPILLLCFGALALTAVAQELEVVHWFPDHPTTEFFPGKSVSCVIGVRNSGASTLNITAAAASLNSPYNATMNLYNFTAQPYYQPVHPGQEMSLEYSMFMPPNLPPREFNMKIQLYFSVEDTMLANMFFNQTINIIEEPKFFDIEMIGLWLVGLAILGLTGFFLAEWLKGLAFVKKATKKSKKSATKEAAPVDKDEWLKGTYYDKKKAAAKGVKKDE